MSISYSDFEVDLKRVQSQQVYSSIDGTEHQPFKLEDHRGPTLTDLEPIPGGIKFLFRRSELSSQRLEFCLSFNNTHPPQLPASKPSAANSSS